MDASNYVLRLKAEQDKALSDTKIQLSKWHTFKDDYLKVKKKLEELPLEITHTHMVPFGPLAMMPGELIHTNEVLVLLGDNWFVDMSANNACQLIDRRLKDINKSIGALEKQLHLLESRVNFTEQEFCQTFKSGEEVDITEPYDSDTERQWKEEHRQSVRRERTKQRRKDSQVATGDDDSVFKLLDSLHEQELVSKEPRLINSIITTTDVSNQKQLGKTSDKPSLSFNDEAPSNNKKSVKWRDELSESGSDDYDSDDSSTASNSSHSTGESAPIASGASIRFKHSQEGLAAYNANAHEESDGSTVTSPRDIYRMFNTRKSALKSPVQSEMGDSVNVERRLTGSAKVLSQQTAVRTGPLTVMDEAVRRSVVEKVLETGATDGRGASQSQTKTTSKVSKFKARRLKQSS